MQQHHPVRHEGLDERGLKGRTPDEGTGLGVWRLNLRLGKRFKGLGVETHEGASYLRFRPILCVRNVNGPYGPSFARVREWSVGPMRRKAPVPKLCLTVTRRFGRASGPQSSTQEKRYESDSPP